MISSIKIDSLKKSALFAILLVLSSASPPALAADLGQACGGRSNNKCAAGLWCDYAVGCGPNIQGTCRKQSFACDAIYLPLCGCDGKTYSSDCDREEAQIKFAYRGACKNSSVPELSR
jgi:Kazal-type serine protease inhibitor domain